MDAHQALLQLRPAIVIVVVSVISAIEHSLFRSLIHSAVLKGMTSEEYADHIVSEFARKFENEYHAIWDPKTNQCEYAAFYIEPIQGTGGYVIPPANFFTGLKSTGHSRHLISG